MLKISNLTKKYKISKKNFFTALNKVNFEINDENMVAIIGESGSGKSTLMNLISTIDTPTNGFIEYDNNKVTFLKEKKRALHRKDNVGFVFQSFNLISDISVLENVAIVMEIAGHKQDERYKRAKELLELVGLKDHLQKKPGYLSGGQKQRVAIARALANNPDLILADEPTGALDSSTSKEIMKLLATIAASGKKVIIVTHDMKVASYCERIIKMQDGNIIEDTKNNSEYLDKIELPTPLNKSKGSLGFSGAFKLSSSAFMKRFKNNILLSIGTAIAIASLLIINIVTSSIDNYFDDLYRYYGNENAITIIASPLEFEAGSEPLNLNELLDLEQYENIVKYENLPTYNAESEGEFTLSDGLAIAPRTIYPNEIRTFGEKDLLSGDAPKSKDEIVVSEDIAKKYGFDKNSAIGETININLKMQSQEENQVNEFKVVGVLSSTGVRNNQGVVYFHNEFMEQYGVYDLGEYIVSYIVEVKDGTADDVISQINSKSSENMANGFMAFSLRELQEVSMMETLLDGTFDIFSIILGVSVFVAAIMIAVLSYVSILERMREVGVLRAIGAQKKDILRMFLIEAFAIGLIAGVIASIIGVASGFALVEVANNVIDFSVLGANLELYIKPLSIVIVILGSTILAVVSSVISIMKGLSIPPVEALKMK